MPTFIESSNCKGIRPSGIVNLKHNLRPNLTARLLNDRHCARCIVAPGGYGKSSLAYEYAQIVFEFKHVFWLKCDSPCFIRDLDKGGLAQSIFACDEQAKLVVCDDIPQLDPVRTQAFCEFIDEVLERECEVIVCCTPSNDTITSHQTDCIQLRSRDLLLSDDEVEIEQSRGCPVNDFDAFGKQWRCASCVWTEGKIDAIVSGISKETLPISLKSAMFAILVLQEGDFFDLARFLRPNAFEDDIVYLAEEYPYLGIDIDDESFHAIKIDVADIAKGVGKSWKTLTSGFLEQSGSDIVVSLANTLIENGSCDRSVEFMRVYGKGEIRKNWIEKNGWKIAFYPDPYSYLNMLENHLSKCGKNSSDVYTVAAWCASILDLEDAAFSYCKRAYRTNSLTWQARKACDLLMLIVKGESVLPSTSSSKPPNGPRKLDMRNDLHKNPLIDMPLDWDLAYELEELLTDEDEFATRWNSHMSSFIETIDDAIKARTLMFSGARFIRHFMAASLEEKGEDIWKTIDVISSLAIKVFESDETGNLNWPEYFAIKTIAECSDQYPYRFSEAFKVSDIAAMRRTDMELFDQKGKWLAEIEAARRRKGEFELTHPDAFRKGALPASELSGLRAATPTLSIMMFGGMTCWIGDKKEDIRLLTREKSKELLAILALNLGREVSREKLVRMLWPESNFEPANKNLYVVWSNLRRSLAIGESCPYLLKTQNGFCLDSRFVSSDLIEFEDLCRSLIFGCDDLVLWEELYGKVCGKFSDDLLPFMTDNLTIESARKKYRDQLVDGLVSASNRLFAQNEVRGATWYAREAKRRDPAREDVYIALMEAQIASDQRACALDTYFECRRFLSETMGIDPSAKVMTLYRSIIEEEHEI